MYAREKCRKNNKQGLYLLDLDKWMGVEDEIMICVASQLLSHQSYSFIVLITSFSMIKENRPSRKKFVDERRERERKRQIERERERMREHWRMTLRPSQETK